MSRISTYAGHVIAGRFEVSSALGEGASGTVWVARDRVLGIPVALKVLRSTMRLEPKRLAAFEREARLCERMLSPNIVRVLGFGVDQGEVPYIAYELLPGTTLAHRIASGECAGLDELETVIVQIARGLARAHSLGVTHRDIKPSNVFLTQDDREKPLAKILDFGIASLTGHSVTEGDGLYGTFEYVAPELVFQTSEADARCDLYSLTAVAYEFLTGITPLEATSIEQLVVRMASGQKAKSCSSVVGPAAAGTLDPWFQRGLARAPVDRFQTARELAEELHRVIKIAKAANPLLRSKPTIREMTAVTELDATRHLSAQLGSGQKLPAMRPRMPSFVFDVGELEAPQSRVVSRDPRRDD